MELTEHGRDRSVMTIFTDELPEIINSRAGTGKLRITREEETHICEIFGDGRKIGYTNIKESGIIKARYIKIHYSKTGTHAVPYSAGEKT